jgi:hypothetical protein
MSGKRVTIDGIAYGLENKEVDTVVEQVRTAMESRTVAALPLLDGDDRPVTVYVNGAVVASVMVDLDGDGRPSEIC